MASGFDPPPDRLSPWTESRLLLNAHVHNTASLMDASGVGGAPLGLNHKRAEAEAFGLSAGFLRAQQDRDGLAQTWRVSSRCGNVFGM